MASKCTVQLPYLVFLVEQVAAVCQEALEPLQIEMLTCNMSAMINRSQATVTYLEFRAEQVQELHLGQAVVA